MPSEFEKILDECIDRINKGEDLESCLADYPQYANELSLFLGAMMKTKSVYSFKHSDIMKAEAKQRFNATLKETQQQREERQPMLTRLFGWSRLWATATAVILIVIVGYFGLRTVLFDQPESISKPEPSQTIDTPDSGIYTTPQPSPEGNFVFLISDAVNAIDNFSSLNLTISSIGLLPEGSDKWIEIEPEENSVDLTTLQGDAEQEIWRDNLATGSYTNVFIYVSQVTGTLKGEEDSDPIEIKLPSGKLHLSMPFQVSAESITHFTYDLTVIATGNAKNGGKYILKPVIGESGVRVEQANGNN